MSTQIARAPGMQIISESALLRRLSRALRHKGESIHACAWNSRWFSDLGRYYVADGHNHLVATHVDLSEKAQELGIPARCAD